MPKSWALGKINDYSYQYYATYDAGSSWLWDNAAEPYKIDNSKSKIDTANKKLIIEFTRPLKYKNNPNFDLEIDSTYSLSMSWAVIGSGESNKDKVKALTRSQNMKILPL